MTVARSPLARRIALTSAVILAAVSVLVLLAVWSVLNSVASSSISVDPSDATSSSPEVVEATYQLASGAVTNIMLLTGTALLAVAALGSFISYWAAKVSLRRVAEVSAHTRRISASTLDERLNLTGPPDEIKELADTIDNTLSALDEAFAQQERFAANASHELRTPLAVLRTSIESLSRVNNEAAGEDLARAERSTARMETVLDSLMLLAQTKQLPADRRFPIDLSASMRIAYEDFAEDFVAQKIDVSISIKEDVNTTGDQTLVLQAIHNLLANAQRYTPSGGRAQIVVDTEGDDAVVVVTNTGRRLEPSEAVRLAEPFNRGENSRQNHIPGTGLGLSIVNSIAVQHGGALTILANPEGGLTATIRLPRTASGARGPAPSPGVTADA
jgi:signal transduction histidine kinase